MVSLHRVGSIGHFHGENCILFDSTRVFTHNVKAYSVCDTSPREVTEPHQMSPLDIVSLILTVINHPCDTLTEHTWMVQYFTVHTLYSTLVMEPNFLNAFLANERTQCA